VKQSADELELVVGGRVEHGVQLAGRTAIPRLARMTADERIRACAYALAFAFNAEEEIERRKDDAPLLERMLGFRHGRGGGLASIVPLDENTLRVAGFRPPSELHAMLDSATDDEFEFVRRLLHAAVVWMPLLVPQFIAQFGEKAKPVGELARKLFADLPPEHYAFAATAMLASLQAKGHPADELRRQLGQVTQGTINLEMLSVLPSEERRSAFKQLPDQDQRDAAGELMRRRAAGA
jgi:hypothetical protein